MRMSGQLNDSGKGLEIWLDGKAEGGEPNPRHLLDSCGCLLPHLTRLAILQCGEARRRYCNAKQYQQGFVFCRPAYKSTRATIQKITGNLPSYGHIKPVFFIAQYALFFSNHMRYKILWQPTEHP
jgi:hypothetical protein